jgi:phosphatidylinositol alpha-1,6-mannosyltransferase
LSRHLLVTNDFPPKIGGIQSYLWELWRRLPPDDFVVLTSPYEGAARFDAAQAFEVRRTPEPVLLPSPIMTHRVRRLAAEVGAQLVVIDPAVPLGIIGPELGLPYAAVLHGAEVTVPGRLPVTRTLLSRVLSKASLLISAGGYPEVEARRAAGGSLPPVVQVPPGVDVNRFVPLAGDERREVRSRLGLAPEAPLVVSVSRLVPRKGMDVLIQAAARLHSSWPELQVAISGSGRDRARLERLIARTGAPVRLMGRLPNDDLANFYAAGDVFAVCCRTRWGGLEQEGFGIIFVEASAAGVACVAGRSGGSAEAVEDGVSGLVVDDPTDPVALAATLDRLLADGQLREKMGAAGRARAEQEFAYEVLAERLHEALEQAMAGGR